MSEPNPSYGMGDVQPCICKLVADSPDQGDVVAENRTDQDKKKLGLNALLLTPALRVDEVSSETKNLGFASQRTGLSNLHTALTSHDEVQGESIVQNLRENWVAPKPDEYYEDETDEGLTVTKSGEKWAPSENVQSVDDKQAEAARLLEQAAKAKSELAAPDPEFEWRREGLGQIVQSLDDVEEEPETSSQKDSVLSELHSFRSPIEPASEDDEPITIPRFRHRGWSYDLASAAGWNTERTSGSEASDDAQESSAVEEAQDVTATADAHVEDVVEDAPTTKIEAIARELTPEVASDIAPQVAEKASAALVDGTLIDQEMLRDIVGDILREEMSGALGERITRNVRKLVRREIHRAMMTQDFD